jgi:hypothetical protein
MSYIALATTTLGSTAATVTFSSIPATYRDLVLVIRLGASAPAVATVGLQFNGDTGNNYSWVSMVGTGSSTSSGSSTQDRGIIGYFLNTTSAFMATLQVFDYAQTNKQKTAIARESNSSESVTAIANRWANTNAVTSMAISAAVSSFPVGSTFSLYGVA